MGAPPIEKVSFRSPWKTITTINPNSDGSVAQSLEGNIWATGKEFGFGNKDGLKIHI